ncbi:MAG: hypothetical protein DRP58_09450, partial [Spirochaetes bacterium]
MKELSVPFILIISLSILISCNSKKETPPPQTDIISETPVVKQEQPAPKQSWKEQLSAVNEISTEKDINTIKAIIEKAVREENLDELQEYLETEAEKDKVPPQILFGLSLVYGRKGLVKEEYKIIEKLEEQVKQRPGIAFNLSLVYGRKDTLKSQIDKAEAEALALLKGYIAVKSIPEGADVYLDGELKGTTPFTTKGLDEGSYAVEIRMEDYTDISKTTSVKAGKTTEVAEELVLIPGSLVINSDPIGSTVLLAGEKVGITPLEISKIEVGYYELTISKDNYEDQIISTVIIPNEIATVNPKLIQLTGNLYLTNLSLDANILVDHILKWPINNRIENLKPGNHLIQISKRGYLEKEANFFIQPNKTTNINGKLTAAIPYATIKIDGRDTDWDMIEPIITDNLGDNNNGPNGTDLHKIYLATDGIYLYTKIDLADGKPSAKPLFYVIGIETPDKSFSRLLFTQYNGTWSTGVDKWTSGNYHEQIAKGTIKSRNNIIETRYKLKDIGISVDQQLLFKAWDDPSGQNYDNTSQVPVAWTNHHEFFVAQGKIRGEKINERTLSPTIHRNQGSDNVTKFILYTSNNEEIGIQFQVDKVEAVDQRVREEEFKLIIFSSIIEKSEDYSGSSVSGKLNIFENSNNWISGSFSLTSN